MPSEYKFGGYKPLLDILEEEMERGLWKDKVEELSKHEQFTSTIQTTETTQAKKAEQA